MMVLMRFRSETSAMTNTARTNLLRRPARRLLCALAMCCATISPSHASEPGLLLREGIWNGGVGSYAMPTALSDRKPDAWPADQWYRLSVTAQAIELSAVVTPPTGQPKFLSNIRQQLTAPEDLAEQEKLSAANYNITYLRVPGVRLKSGAIAPYRFRNGTSQIAPKLDHRYELMLGTQAFAFTVQNGLRGRNGEPYGDGAVYIIEYDGKTFEYRLGEFGWDSRIQAIADIDGDGKPDFMINVGGTNSGYEAVLLSSVAKPGVNPATASLKSMGC